MTENHMVAEVVLGKIALGETALVEIAFRRSAHRRDDCGLYSRRRSVFSIRAFCDTARYILVSLPMITRGSRWNAS